MPKFDYYCEELVCLNCHSARAKEELCIHLTEELNSNYRQTLELVYLKCLNCTLYIKGFYFQKHQHFCQMPYNHDNIYEVCKYCKRTKICCLCRVNKYDYSEEYTYLMQNQTKNCQYCQKDIEAGFLQNHLQICPFAEIECDECRIQLQRQNYLKHQIKCIRGVLDKIKQQVKADRFLCQLANVRLQQENANFYHAYLNFQPYKDINFEVDSQLNY